MITCALAREYVGRYKKTSRECHLDKRKQSRDIYIIMGDDTGRIRHSATPYIMIAPRDERKDIIER